MHDVIRNSVYSVAPRGSAYTPCQHCFWPKTWAPWSSAKVRVIGYDRCLSVLRRDERDLRGFVGWVRDIICRAWRNHSKWQPKDLSKRNDSIYFFSFGSMTSKRPAQIFSYPVPQQEVPFTILNCMFIFMQDRPIIFEELTAFRSFLIRWIDLQPQLLVIVYDQSSHI